MDKATWVQFLNETDSILIRANGHEKDINLSLP